MGKKILVLFVIALAIVTLGFFSISQAQKKAKIGIVMYSNEARYIEGKNGAIAQLKKEGFDEQKVDFDIRDAEGKDTKVTEIAKDFKEKGMNLIIAYGTQAATNTYKEIKDIPIIISMVYDPVGAGLAKSMKSSGNNITGASNFVNMKSVVMHLRLISPAKKIGVLYNEGEKNSVLQLDEFKKLQDEMGILVIGANVTTPEQVGEATRSLVERGVDSLFMSGSNVLSKNLAAALEVAAARKIPTVSHLSDRVKEGVLLSVSPSAFKVGELAGKKAAEVLRGAKPTDIPIETLEDYDITVNATTAKAIGKVMPDGLLKKAKKIIE